MALIQSAGHVIKYTPTITTNKTKLTMRRKELVAKKMRVINT